VCDRHPAVNGGVCHNCHQKIEAEKRQRKNGDPVKFATYRGYVVGFYPDGGGKLVPRLLQRNPETLPKSRTLDLNTYIKGFTREQVKRIKSAILVLAEV
jgi:hypothetical protein